MRNDAVTQYLVERVRKWLREGQHSQAELARAAGVSGAQISNLLDGSRGAGRKTLRGVAEALGTTWPHLEEAALRWAAAHREKFQQGDRYPNRARAAPLALEDGVSLAAVEDVLKDVLPNDTDFPVLWWTDRMRDRERQLRTRDVLPKNDEVPPAKRRSKKKVP